MDKFLEKLNKAKSKINLAEERKENLYLRIISAAVEEKRKPVVTAASFWNLYLRRPVSVAAGVLGILVITASTSFASESSLPGDILYPLKKNVNEAVLKLFADTPQKKAQLAANLVERRLSEAAQLASAGRLTEDISDTLAVEVEQISGEARGQISLLRDDNKPDIAINEASRLETSLRANRAVLRGVMSKKEKDEPVVIADLGLRIDGLVLVAEEDRVSIENSALASGPISGAVLFMAAKSIEPIDVVENGKEVSDEIFTKKFAEDSLKETVNSIEKLKESTKNREDKDGYNPEAVNDVIKSAERDIEQAKNNLENNDVKNSLLLINQSGRKVREAEIISDAERRLNVRVFEKDRDGD